MKFKPLHDRVLIKKVLDSEEKTAGGIIIPDTAKEASRGRNCCGRIRSQK